MHSMDLIISFFTVVCMVSTLVENSILVAMAGAVSFYSNFTQNMSVQAGAIQALNSLHIL